MLFHLIQSLLNHTSHHTSYHASHHVSCPITSYHITSLLTALSPPAGLRGGGSRGRVRGLWWCGRRDSGVRRCSRCTAQRRGSPRPSRGLCGRWMMGWNDGWIGEVMKWWSDEVVNEWMKGENGDIERNSYFMEWSNLWTMKSVLDVMTRAMRGHQKQQQIMTIETVKITVRENDK